MAMHCRELLVYGEHWDSVGHAGEVNLRKFTEIRHLQKHGKSYALIFDKPLMNALYMKPTDPLQVVVSGCSVVITPVHIGISRNELDATIRRLRPRYKT